MHSDEHSFCLFHTFTLFAGKQFPSRLREKIRVNSANSARLSRKHENSVKILFFTLFFRFYT